MNPFMAESQMEVTDWNTEGNNGFGGEADCERGEVSII